MGPIVLFGTIHGPTVLFQITFSFIYSTFSKISRSKTNFVCITLNWSINLYYVSFDSSIATEGGTNVRETSSESYMAIFPLLCVQYNFAADWKNGKACVYFIERNHHGEPIYIILALKFWGSVNWGCGSDGTKLGDKSSFEQ